MLIERGELVGLVFAYQRIDGQVQIDAPVELNGDVTLGNGPGDDILIRGLAVFEETATSEGVVAFENDVEVEATGSLVVSGTLLVGVGGGMVLNEPMQFVTNGRVPLRFDFVSDASQDVFVAQGNVLQASISTGRAYTINDTDAVNGDFFLFINASVYPLEIKDPATVVLISALQQVSVTEPGFALCMRVGSADWRVLIKVSG